MENKSPIMALQQIEGYISNTNLPFQRDISHGATLSTQKSQITFLSKENTLLMQPTVRNP